MRPFSLSDTLDVPLFVPLQIDLELEMAQTDSPQEYKPARLRKPAKGAADQRWMIVWWQFSIKAKKVIRKRQGFDLNTIEDKKARERRAADLIQVINKGLKKGYVLDPDKQTQRAKVEPKTLNKPVGKFTPVLEAYDAFYRRRQASGLAPATLAGYVNLRKFLAAWIQEELGDPEIMVRDFSAEHGESFCHWQANRPSRGGKPISNKTYNNYLIYLHAFFNWLIEIEVIKQKNHPLKNEKEKKVAQSTQHRPYTNDQLKAIMNLCRTRGLVQLELYLQFLYYTFARPRSEVRLLRVEDLQRNTIWIRPALDKARVGRHVDIPPALEALIKAHGLRKLPPSFYLFGRNGVPGAEPTLKTSLFDLFKTVLKDLQLAGQGYDLYGFKHTGNINLYLATKDMYAVMKQNGHTSLTMTERYLRDLGVLQNETVMNRFPTMGGV